MKRTLLFAIIMLTGTASLVQASEKMSLWQRMQPPEDIGTYGHLIHYLFNFTTYLNLFFFLLVCIGIFGFSFLYRASRHKKALYTHGKTKKEIWIVVGIALAVFILIDMQITRISAEDYQNVFMNFPDEKKEEVYKVEVMAQQWMWNVRVPGKDGIFNTIDDIVTNNDFHVPMDKKVVFQIISKDVIHALYIPNILMKIDATPGKITRMWAEFKKAGTYEIACAEICGTNHYKMAARLIVHTPEDFAKWQEAAQAMALTVNNPEEPDSFWGWQWKN
jgi:cytochrome c oxidase subunit 2